MLSITSCLIIKLSDPTTTSSPAKISCLGYTVTSTIPCEYNSSPCFSKLARNSSTILLGMFQKNIVGSLCIATNCKQCCVISHSLTSIDRMLNTSWREHCHSSMQLRMANKVNGLSLEGIMDSDNISIG